MSRRGVGVFLSNEGGASTTVTEIGLSDLDLRYQGHRLQQPRLEDQLLASIAQAGIQEPLQGVRGDGRAILLNGFKRARQKASEPNSFREKLQGCISTIRDLIMQKCRISLRANFVYRTFSRPGDTSERGSSAESTRT